MAAVSPAWVAPYLTHLRRCGVISRSARAAGVSLTNVHARAKADPDFKAAQDEAREEAHDALEERLVTTALEGHRETVVHQGQVAWASEPVLEPDGSFKLDDKGRVVQRPVLDDQGRIQPLVVVKPADSNLHLALRHYRRFVERHELTGADGAALVPEATPAEEAKKIAFALALGRKLARETAAAQPAGAGDDIT